MFNTGSRTMESVLLEHAGHDVELYEFTEDGKNGVVLWCKDCRENVIKHFLSIPWETQQENRTLRAERLGAVPFEQWQRAYIRECFETDGETPQYQDSEWDEVYDDYLDTLEPDYQPRQDRTVSAPLWDVEEKDCWTT